MLLGVDYHFKDYYYMSSLFEEGEWFEISEAEFDNMCIKYRDYYKMRYEGNTRIFTFIKDGVDHYKIVRKVVDGPAPFITGIV